MSLLDEQNAGLGMAPEDPAATAAREQSIISSTPVTPTPLPGGGFLGDLPAGVGTRASPFAPQVPPQQLAPPAMAPPAQASPMAPAPVPVAPRAGAPAAPSAEARALTDEQKAYQAQAAAKEAEGPANQAIEDSRAAGFEQKAAAQAQQAKDYEAQQKIAQQAHTNAVADAQDAADAYRNFKLQDFWAKGRNDVPLRSTMSRITTIVGAFLGGYANPGGTNAVTEMIKRETERDFEKQKLQLQSKENYAALKRQGVKDVDEFQKDQLARLQIKQGMAMQAIADHIDAQTATATGKLRAAEGKTAADSIRTQGAQQAFEGQAKLVDSKLKTAQTAEAYAAAAKDRAQAKAAGQKSAPDDDEIFYDKQGNAVGLVAKGRGGAQAFATRDANFSDALAKMQAYRDYIQKIGGRPKSMDQIKQAKVLYNNAGLAVAAVSPNGTSDTAQEHERASLGPDPSSITGWAAGPSLSAVEDKIKQVGALQKDYRIQTLRPLHPGQVGGRSAVPGEAEAPAQQAPSLPPGLPPGSIDTGRKTRDGRPVFKLANGQMVAATQ